MDFNITDNKVDLTHLFYNRDKAITDTFLKLTTNQMLIALEAEIADPKSKILKIIDSEIIAAFKKVMFETLTKFTAEMKIAVMSGTQYNMTNILRLAKIINRFLTEDVFLGDESLNFEKYLDLLIYSPNHQLIADVFDILGKTSFERNQTLVFYYILSYIKHWNNHNDRHWTLVDIVHIQPDFLFEYVDGKEIVSIKRPADLKAAYPGLSFMQITMKIIEEEKLKLTIDDNLTHELLCKVRLALCPDNEKQQVIRGVISALRIFSLVDLMWFKSNPKVIPNIFELPPNYVEIFRQVLQLFLHPECTLKNRIAILDMLKVVIAFQLKRGQSSDILVSLLENYILLQHFLSDMKDYIQKKKTKYIPESNFQNTDFVLKVLKLFDNLDSGLILDSTSVILQGFFYMQGIDPKIIQQTGIQIVNLFLEQNNEAQLVQHIFKQLNKQNNPNSKIYVIILIELLSEEVRQRNNQRRDSSALARNITQSNIFETLINLVKPPFENQQIGIKTIDLLTSICSQNPLLTDKCSTIIHHILDSLRKIENYPTDIEGLISIIQFLHYICLKQGPIRDKVLGDRIIQVFMEIFIVNKFSEAIVSKRFSSINSSISRFQSNISLSKIQFYTGMIKAFEQTAISAEAYQLYMNSLLINNSQLNEPIKYEQLMARIIALFKLSKKLSIDANLLLSTKSLFKYRDELFCFKYLNIHNTFDNKELAKNNYYTFSQNISNVLKVTKSDTCIFVPLEFLEQQKKVNSTLQHIFVASFFDLLERSKKEPKYKQYLLNFTWFSTIERIFNMMTFESRIPDNAFNASIPFMVFLPSLDKFRAKEDVFNLQRRTSKINKQFTSLKQKVDFLRHQVKGVSDRCGPFSMAHQCLRKLLILSSQRKDYNTIKQYSKVIIEDISNLNNIELSLDLQFLYLLKLKLQNLQYILNTTSTPQSHSNDFPIQFAVFAVFYQIDPIKILKPLIRIATFIYSQPCGEKTSDIFIFKMQVMMKIFVIFQNMVNFREDNNRDSQQSNKQYKNQVQAINFLTYQFLKDFIEVVPELPRTPVDTAYQLQDLMGKIIQQILRTIRIIHDVVTDQHFYMTNQLIPFEVDKNKRMTKKQLISQTMEIYQKFKNYQSQQIENFAIVTDQFIVSLLESVIKEQLKLYQRKRALSQFYNLISTKILKVSKQLFEDFVINLGIKHSKSIILQETSAKQCVINVCVLVDSLTAILDRLIYEGWFGRGQLEITPHYTSQILRFITSIIVNWNEIKDKNNNTFDPFDSLIQKTLKFIKVAQRYLVFQLKNKSQQKVQEQKDKIKPKAVKKHQKSVNKNIKPSQPKQTSKLSNGQIIQPSTPLKSKVQMKKKKNKIKKLWQMNSQISLFIESVLSESIKIPLMKSNTYQSILQYLQIKLGKEQSIIEQAKFNFKNFNIFEVQVKDSDKSGLLILTIQIVMKLLPTSHQNIDIEGIIKRIFFENDPKKTMAKLPFSTIQNMEKMWENKDEFIKIVKKICTITKNQGQSTTPVHYNTALLDIAAHSIALKPAVDYTSISLKIKKPKKLHHKKSMSKDDSLSMQPSKTIKYIDYVPEGQSYEIIRQLVDFVIQSIIKEAVTYSKTDNYKSNLAFNSMIGIVALLTISRVWPTLIPFITRYRCRKTLQNMYPLVEQLSNLTGNSIKIQQTADMTFIGFLIRVATPLMFDKIQILLCELCADNYVLVQSNKDVTIPLGHYIRTKVIREMSSFDINQNVTKTISYLTLLTNLLGLKEFSTLALQQGVVEILHKQLVSLKQQGYERQPYLRLFSFICSPLTILHNVNLHIHITKQKPLQVKGKNASLKDQMIPASYFKKNKFLMNWPYTFPDSTTQNELGEELDFDNFEEIQRRSFLADSQNDSSGSDNDSSDIDDSIQSDDVFMNNYILEQDDDEQDGMSRGWTSNIGDQSMGFDDDFDQQLEQIPEIDEIQLQNGQSDDLNVDDMQSDQIMDELYGQQRQQRAEDVMIYDLSQSDRSVSLRDVQKIIQNLTSVESQGQLSSFFVKLMNKVIDILKRDENPLVKAIINSNSPAAKLIKVSKSIFKFLQQNSNHIESLPKSNAPEMFLFHRKLLFDDSQNVNYLRRRNGEYLRMTNNQIMLRPISHAPTSMLVHLNQTGQMVVQPIENSSLNQNVQQEEEDNDQEEEDLQNGEIIMDDIDDDDMFINVNNFQEFENNIQEQLPGLTDQRIRQLLRQNQFDQDYFYSLDSTGRYQIIQNLLGMVDINNVGNQEEQKQSNNDQQHLEQHQQQNNEGNQIIEQPLPETGRRKISMQYHKKIEKDPKQIIGKEKKQNKIYLCENAFLETVMNILYYDLYDFGNNFPYIMMKALSAHPSNESNLLACLIIILKHPNLQEQKLLHNESPDKFPKTVLIQRNNEIITDYKREGYQQVCQKVLYVLSHLSKSNPSGMLLSKHNKVQFLPSWYYIEQIPYYQHLIQLIKTEHFKNNKLLGELTDILFNIVNHHSMKYIHALQHKEAVEFQMKLNKPDIELLCYLLQGQYSQTKSDQVIKNMVLLLCVDDSNLKMFIQTFEGVVDSLSKKSIKLLKSEISQQYTNQDKLHNILRIVASMFEDQYQAKVEKKHNEKDKIKGEVLKEFKKVLQCPSLMELFKLCSELVVDYPKKITHLERIQVIMFSFFIIYNIVLIEEQQQKKTNQISKMQQLNSIKKTSISGPLFGFEVEKTLGQIFNFMKINAKAMINHLLKEIISNLKKSHRSKQNPSIFNQPVIKILSKYPSLVDYQNKRSMFKAEVKYMRKNKMVKTVNLNVDRQNVLLSSLNQVMGMSNQELLGKFHITFDGEQGQDAGGLTREWFTLLSKQIFNPHYALFEPSSTGTMYQPSPKSYVNPNHLQFFKFIGRVVGKALHDGYLLDAYFTPAFYKHILGKPLSWTDMQEQDYEFYKNLDWLLKNDVTDFDLTFSCEQQYFGKIEIKDLVPNGSNIAVTQQNKMQYVQRRCYNRMAAAVQKQIQNFLVGFHQLIPHSIVSIFEPKQLQLMISGLPQINIQDLKQNTTLVNYEKSDNIIIWFFQILQSFDNTLRAAFLQFVTGTSRVPSQGFKSLRGMSGPQKFTIQKDFGQQKLPRAHTCFNQLDLPPYSTKQILIEKLTLAITQGKQGFGFI